MRSTNTPILLSDHVPGKIVPWSRFRGWSRERAENSISAVLDRIERAEADAEIYRAILQKEGGPLILRQRKLFPDGPELWSVADGFRFMGGDPSSPENWERE